jgi:uncharacterized membrane protein
MSASLGHAAATGSGPIRLAVEGLHLLAAMGWAGGVLVLAGVVLPLLRRAETRPAALAVLRAYGIAAALCLVAAGLAGLVLAGSSVASVDALLLSTYGRSLLVKLVLVGLAAVLGLRTALLLRAGGHRLNRSLLVEATALAGVLAAAAVLASAAPAIGPRFTADPAAARTQLASHESGDLVESLSVRPNRLGRKRGRRRRVRPQVPAAGPGGRGVGDPPRARRRHRDPAGAPRPGRRLDGHAGRLGGARPVAADRDDSARRSAAERGQLRLGRGGPVGESAGSLRRAARPGARLAGAGGAAGRPGHRDNRDPAPVRPSQSPTTSSVLPASVLHVVPGGRSVRRSELTSVHRRRDLAW